MAEMERLVSQELGEVRELLHIVCINHHAEKVFEKVFDPWLSWIVVMLSSKNLF